MRPLLLALPLLLAACGGDAGPASGGETLVPSPDPGVDLIGELVIEKDPGGDAPTQRWTLACGQEPGVVAGDHPAAEAACAHLRDLEDPFAPLPEDQLCAQVYGGPQTAHVTGTWRGSPVDLQLSLVDACKIAQWERLGPLLPGPVGAGDGQ